MSTSLLHCLMCSRFQSSPVPKDGCNHRRPAGASGARSVSILTRPGGRVQQAARMAQKPNLVFQSSPVPEDGCNCIEDYLLHRLRRCFNPHPSRRTGATPCQLPEACAYRAFQSSPVPEDGCNDGSDSRSSTLRGFQSSPVPEDGCNQHTVEQACLAPGGFNPHPSRRTGATGRCEMAHRKDASVSILTRPGGRVQP